MSSIDHFIANFDPAHWILVIVFCAFGLGLLFVACNSYKKRRGLLDGDDLLITITSKSPYFNNPDNPYPQNMTARSPKWEITARAAVLAFLAVLFFILAILTAINPNLLGFT